MDESSPKLSAEERQSLKACTAGDGRPEIPAHIMVQLLLLDLIIVASGKPMLTEKGKRVLKGG